MSRVLLCDAAVADRAATEASRRLGLGRPEPVRRSSAATYTAGHGFLRVVSATDDPSGTLAVAGLVAATIGGARPLADAPLEVEGADGYLYVEAYERLVPVGVEPVAVADLGERLAALHTIEIGGLDLRWLRRVDTSLERLAQAPMSVRERLEPHVLEARDRIASVDAPLGLCHGDPVQGNLVTTRDGVVWVDLEYAGAGPVGHDVAFCVVEQLRFRGPQAAREFLTGYQAGGGVADLVDVMQLAGVRDVYGVVDYSYQTDAHSQAELARRLASFDEPFRQTRWGKR